jgi:hypothetical protein
MIISFLPGIEGLVTIWDSDQQLVLFGDTVTAGTFWAPAISGSSSDSFKEFWQFGTNSSVLVGGPYLVRSAAILGSRLALRGDLDAGVRLTVIAPSNIRSITWNDELVASDAEAALALTSRGGFVGHLKATGAAFGITVPVLQDWRYANSLPEIEANFSDADWVAANHTTTNIPYPLYYGDGRILYGCDYGLCACSL